MSTLLVELPFYATGFDAPTLSTEVELRYALTADAESILSSGQTLATLLPRADQLVAVVPAQALSWQQLDVPKIPVNRFDAGLQALLEDHVLTDPTQLHLALMPGLKPGVAATGAWVAVCDKAWLRQALALVEARGQSVSRIAPVLAPALPQELPRSHVSSATGISPHALISTSHASGVWTYPLSAHPHMGVATAAVVHAEPSVAALADGLLGQDAQDPVKVVVTSSAQMLLSALSHDWNLAQGDLARTPSTRRWQLLVQAMQAFAFAKPWRIARWALASTVALHLLGLNVWAWQERATLADKRTRMQGLLTQSFPQVKLVIDAPVQMQKEVRKLEQRQGLGSTGDLESMLHVMGSARTSGRTASAIDYAQQQATLKDVSLSDTDMSRLQQAAQVLGLSVRAQGKDVVMGVAP